MSFTRAKATMPHFSPILFMALRFTLTAFCLVWFFRSPLPLYRHIFWIALVTAATPYSHTFNGAHGIDAYAPALFVQLEVPFGLLLAWIFLGDGISVKYYQKPEKQNLANNYLIKRSIRAGNKNFIYQLIQVNSIHLLEGGEV